MNHLNLYHLYLHPANSANHFWHVKISLKILEFQSSLNLLNREIGERCNPIPSFLLNPPFRYRIKHHQVIVKFMKGRSLEMKGKKILGLF